MIPDQVLYTTYNLIERSDEVVLYYDMQFLQGFKIVLLLLQDVLMGHISQTEQQTLGAIEHNLLSAQINPFFVLRAASWLYQILGVKLDRHRTASRLLRFAMVLIIGNFINIF